MDAPAVISLTFDDGFRCQFDKALPILNSHALPATFFLIANHEATHEGWTGHTDDWFKIDWRDEDIGMLRKAVQDGHEIGSHSVTHHPKKMPMQPDIEAGESRQLLEGWLGTKVSSFCYPFYRSHAYLANAVKNAGYEQARGGAKAAYYRIGQDGTLDRFNVDCRQISSNESVREWVQPGRWHVLTFHGIGGARDGWVPIPVEQFAKQMTELAKLRDSKIVEVLTFRDGVKETLNNR